MAARQGCTRIILNELDRRILRRPRGRNANWHRQQMLAHRNPDAGDIDFEKPHLDPRHRTASLLSLRGFAEC